MHEPTSWWNLVEFMIWSVFSIFKEIIKVNQFRFMYILKTLFITESKWREYCGEPDEISKYSSLFHFQKNATKKRKQLKKMVAMQKFDKMVEPCDVS